MLENEIHAAALQADVATLRSQFPRTADLYKEVCALMFFRYGMTPTTNSLYQLVRKGSMSVLSEALRAFWSDLRKNAKVNLEHAGLPDHLAQAAGDLVAQLWGSAQASADEAIQDIRQSAFDERDSARAEQRRLQAAFDVSQAECQRLREQLSETNRQIATMREQAAISAAAVEQLSTRLSEARQEASSATRQLDIVRADNAAEIEKVTARISQAEERFAAAEKRAIAEIDRERVASAKLAKLIDTERGASASVIERLRSELASTQLALAKQSQEAATIRSNRDQTVAELEKAQATIEQFRNVVNSLTGELAAERTRVELLHKQPQAQKSGQEKAKVDQRPGARRRRHGTT